MWLAGVEVTGSDSRTLVDLLMRIGRDADLALAHRIERACSGQDPLLALSYEESGALDDPPDGLAELRGSLAHDRRDRTSDL